MNKSGIEILCDARSNFIFFFSYFSLWQFEIIGFNV